MKSRLLKALLMSTAVATVVTAMSVTAFADVTVTQNSTTQITASSTDAVDRMVLAEFDIYGKMTNLTVGSQGGTSVSNGFTYSQEYKTKIMRFSDFGTATALSEHRTLGSNTLFVWQGSDGLIDMTSGSLDKFGTAIPAGKAAGVITEGTGLTFKSNGTSFSPNWIHLPTSTIGSDWTVFQFDLTVNSKNGYDWINDEIVFYLDDGVTHDNGYTEIGTINASMTGSVTWKMNGSTVQSGNGTKTIAVAIDHINGTYSVYTVSGSSYSQVGSTKSTSNPMKALRFSFEKHYYDITLDNMYVYEGVVPRTSAFADPAKVIRYIVLNANNVLDGDDYAAIYNDSTYSSQVSGVKAVHANSGVVWNGYEKVMLTNTPFESNGVQMVPKNELASALGVSCGSTSGQTTKDGVVYVPIESFLSGTSYTHLSGASHNANCYVLKSGFSPSNVDNFNRWMLYYRPSADQVLADYKASALSGEHPRLIATQSDFDRMRTWYNQYVAMDDDFKPGTSWSAALDYPWYAWMRNGRTLAEQRVTAIEGGELPQYSAYDAVGRMNYQRKFASDAHLLAAYYQMSGDTRYAEALWKLIEVIADRSEFTDFNMGHMLDVSEAQAAMAIAYDWMYDYWVAYDAANGTDRLEQIEDCMYNNGLYFAWDGVANGGSYSGELLSTNNHGTVANNGTMMLALALMDKYPSEASFVISQALKCQEINIWQWDTGMWYEGAGYWELTMQHTAKFVETLKGVFPGGYGFSGLEGLSQSGIEEVQHHTPLGIYNYGDNNTELYWVPELVWLGNTYNQNDLSYYVYKNKPKGWTSNTSWHGEDVALGLLWLDNATYATTSAFNNYNAQELSVDYCDEELDVAIVRDTHDVTIDSSTYLPTSEYTVAGFKGGQADETHGQIDAGSFIFESDGIRWAQDPGTGTYSSGYFDNTSGGTRWRTLATRGEAHSTIIVNPPSDGSEDQTISARAELSLVKSTDAGVIATVNMKPVLFNVSAATRGFFFTDNRESLVIRDEFTPSAGGTAYWTMMLPGGSTVTDDGNGRITVVYNDETLYVDYVITGGTVGTKSLVGSDFQPINSTNIIDIIRTNGQIRIPVTLTNGTATTITVKLTPASVTSATAISAYTSGISGWSSLLN